MKISHSQIVIYDDFYKGICDDIITAKFTPFGTYIPTNLCIFKIPDEVIYPNKENILYDKAI